MTAPEQKPLPPEVQALVLAELEKQVKAELDPTKALFSGRYGDGSKNTFFSPIDGREIGQVWRTKPTASWAVTDWAALKEHLAESEDAWETVVTVLLPTGAWQEMDPADELYRVVSEHAPHLCGEPEQRLRSEVVGDLVSESSKTGKPVCPGISRRKKDGVLTVRSHKDAADVIGEMVAANLIDWRGRRVLEQKQEESA